MKNLSYILKIISVISFLLLGFEIIGDLNLLKIKIYCFVILFDLIFTLFFTINKRYKIEL